MEEDVIKSKVKGAYFILNIPACMLVLTFNLWL